MRTPKLKTYFIGIGGIGVSALAKYYLEKGHEVSGSDLVSSEITDALEKIGAKIFIGPHKKKNITFEIGKVIYSPAVQPGNPEIKEAKKLNIKRLSYPEALGELTKKYFTIAVSGTHGKSTTTAMISLILIKAGLDPTVIIGTKLKEFKNPAPYRPAPYTKFIKTKRQHISLGGGTGSGSNCRVGKSKYLVIEADEWQASFLKYFPKIIVLTNIEKEHLDYYKNLRNILKTFKEYIGHLSKDGVLVVNQNDENIKKLLQRKNTTLPTIVENAVYYSLKQKEAGKLKKVLKVPGEHNVSNALAALTVARVLKIPDKIIFKALSEYRGAWRRFEEKDLKIGNWKLKIISDYAHHPTEIKATLSAAREKFPKRKIWCVFQPHQYQRTFYLFADFIKAFSMAPVDKIIITDIYDVAGRENKSIKNKVSSKKLVNKIKSLNAENKRKILHIPDIKGTADYLKKNLNGGEVIIIMGAGDIYKLAP